IDANINFDPQPGDSVTQWLAVGEESFCLDSTCSLAANEFTYPAQSRHTLSGHLVAVSSVPLPAAVWLFGYGLIGLVGFSIRKKA
ncbi:MAG: VPLPA-CTERM sorting domain-containing protein, partial [Gammaproteobacteria bacterium]|nr:VPLPA-CTERM sorting domain-containing protein [Gammaproteobacteria bacterium]